MNHDLFVITGALDELKDQLLTINSLLEKELDEENINWEAIEDHASKLLDAAEELYNEAMIY